MWEESTNNYVFSCELVLLCRGGSGSGGGWDLEAGRLGLKLREIDEKIEEGREGWKSIVLREKIERDVVVREVNQSMKKF